VIGIVTAVEQARYTSWDAPCFLLQTSYVKAVQRGGGLALMIPPDPALLDDPEPALDRIDALILAGGSDLDPASYGALVHPETTGTTPSRDPTELALARAALERDMPLLGICRGMQVLNVAVGGTLLQHVPDVVGSEEHRRHLGTFAGNDHEVVLDEGSLAAQAAGELRHRVLSHHHQAIDRIGDGLIVSGRSVDDDLPEALESPEHDYVLGVQWHPEADPASQVIGSLVAHAAQPNRLGSR
jgi:putative glutamine amidotransferase